MRAGNKERVVQASAGTSFSVVLTDTGKGLRNFVSWESLSLMTLIAVFTFGSAEKGQLGNGTTGERIITGNKTGFDIETKPGMSPSSPSPAR
jgi:alpha-tubulin suppressor-like RCC1 family protein